MAEDTSDTKKAEENLRDLSVMLIEIANQNIQAAFDVATRAAGARTPIDLVNLWSAHIRRQLELLNAQTEQLSELTQRLVRSSTSSNTPGE